MTLDIPPYLLETLNAAGRVDFLSQHTGEFVYSSTDKVFLGNIVRGTSTLFTADAGYEVMGVDSTFGDRGSLYGWAEGKYDGAASATCAKAGSVEWRLFVGDGNQDHLVSSGVNTRLRGCAAAKPLFAFDGDEAAFATEAPTVDAPDGWQIQVVNTLTGEEVKTLGTDADVFSLDIDNGSVAWTQGTLAPTVNATAEFDTSLMLASAQAGEGTAVASNAYHVSLREGRLAWIDDQQTSRRDSMAPGAQVMTATVSYPSPVALGSFAGLPLGGPNAGGELVSWVDGNDIVLVDGITNTRWHLTGTGPALSAWASSRFTSLGWLAATGDGSETLNEVPLAKLSPPLPDFDADTPSSGTPIPTPAPTPSPDTSPVPPPPPLVPVSLPENQIHSVRASGERFAQRGSLVAFTDGEGVELADLGRDTTDRLYSLARGEEVDSVAISGDNVVFTVAIYDNHGGPGSLCPDQGPVSWRIVAHEISSNRDSTVATGRNVEVGQCGAVPPPVAIDGDQVAYGREASNKNAWVVVVQSIATGKVLRTVDTEGSLWSVAIDGSDVAYVETNWPNNRLMLSTAAGPESVAVASDVEEISFADGRLAWSAEAPDVWDVCWTLQLPSLDPIRVSTADYERILDPQTSDGFVAYATSTGDSGIALWDAHANATYELLGNDIYPDYVSVNDGWVVWFNEPDNDPSVIQGLPIADIPGL